ncbi:MAG: hypothetical protein ACOZQL_39080 [Myxococcota bacterium]
MHTRLVTAVVLVLAVSCGRPEEVVLPAAVTELGTPVGTPTSGVIGAAGGTLRTPDGRLEVRFPAGAVTSDTTVRIQPITNTSPGGVGTAYLLEPEGQTFGAPVELTLHYGDADVEGSAPEFLSWSLQQADGTWLTLDSTLDPAAKTRTVTTTHFSRWSPSLDIVVLPTLAKVKTGATKRFEVQTCRADVGTKWRYVCTPTWTTFAARVLGDWTVNGIAGGNATVGTVLGPEKVDYTAPNEVPNPSRVTLSATVTNSQGKLTAPLVMHVDIVGAKDYGGRYEFTQQQGDRVLTGSADLFWKRVESKPDTAGYTPTGQVDAHYTFSDCDPIDVVLQPDPSSKLQIYTEKNLALPKQHQFTLNASAANVTLSCGTPRKAVTTTLVLGFAVGVCNAPPFAQYTDEAVLSGDEECNGTKSHWRFELLSP